MSKRTKIHYFWLVLAAYGVWFAVFSGIEEINSGKFNKVILSLIFGFISYVIIERRIK